MISAHESAGYTLLLSRMGERARDAVATLDLDDQLRGSNGMLIDSTCLAAALNVALFSNLLDRVPSGSAYVAERRSTGQRIRFDHGALRTIRFPNGMTGALPAGEDAFVRILRPLGYKLADTYPLPKLRMTGRAYVHSTAPTVMPQFFVSELHVEQFDSEFANAAQRVFSTSRDPLSSETLEKLQRLEAGEALVPLEAEAVLSELIGAFDRQHCAPRLADYEILLAHSAEAAWIATEGNAFNHATDRVADVQAVADAERAAGRPIKESVEISKSGRVRQTAHRAANVVREFFGQSGEVVQVPVPGSFYEFITRDIDPATGEIDLRFDSGNATGIFQMTRAA
jgi:hypothetical protein